MKTTLFVTVLAAALCAVAPAQDKAASKKKAPSMPAMPKPGPEMNELKPLIGTWTTDETMDPSPMMPTGGTATGTNTVRSGPGGLSVVMDQRSKSAMGPYSGHGVI